VTAASVATAAPVATAAVVAAAKDRKQIDLRLHRGNWRYGSCSRQMMQTQ